MTVSEYELKILAIDIGGTHIKATVINTAGKMLTDYNKVATPKHATPQNVLDAIEGLVKSLPEFEKVGVGFPGYVKDGIIHSAPNLDNDAWQNFDLATKLSTLFGKPTKVVNDADMQGLGVVSGIGFEMTITLGTGFGSALLLNGKLLPHIELGHHPITENKAYDAYVGANAYEELSRKKWNKRMLKVLTVLKVVFNYDRLYIGGGNAKKINFKLDDNIIIVNNVDGIHGAAKLWK